MSLTGQWPQLQALTMCRGRRPAGWDTDGPALSSVGGWLLLVVARDGDVHVAQRRVRVAQGNGWQVNVEARGGAGGQPWDR